MPAFEYRILDAFTRTPFAGNSAGVFVLPSALPTRTLQLIAREINAAETSFIVPTSEENTFDLRWFTPAVEVALCGHATLAAARVLDLPRAVFRTLSGELIAVRTGEGTFELEFPACEKLVPSSQEVRARVTDAVTKALQLENAPRIEYVGTGVGEAFSYSALIHIDDDFDLGAQAVNPEAFVGGLRRPSTLLNARAERAGGFRWPEAYYPDQQGASGIACSRHTGSKS